MIERNNPQLKQNFVRYYHENDPYVATITNCDNSKKEWTKALIELKAIKHLNKIIPVQETAVLFIQTKNQLLTIGDKISLVSPLKTIKNKGNPGEFNSEYFWKSKGITKIGFVPNKAFIKLGNSISWIDKWTLKSRNYLGGILNQHFKDQELALVQALILGDRSYLDYETTSAFGNSGAMHVLAVSGLHIGIILQMILFLLKGFSKFISKKQALLLALLIIWIYTFISGLSASVLRSTFMFSVLAISQVSGKTYNQTNGLFFTGFILLIINPFFLFDIGFQLSFLAMIGIFWFYQPISKSWYIKNKWLRKVWEGTAVGLAAQITTVPLTLFYFHQFPNYFILTNIGLMLSTGLILGLGIFIFAFHWIKYIGKLAVLCLLVVLIFTLQFVSFIDQLPGSTATGFTLNWTVVIISFSLIISFHLFTILVCSFVIHERYLNLKKNEICFFNHSKLTFILKKENDVYCFYDGDSTDLKKIDFITKSYQKLYPGNIHYYSIKKRDWKLNSKTFKFTIKKLKQGRLITLNNTSYYVKRYENDTTNNLNSKVILMPWLVKENKLEYPLKNGGIQFSF
jgi:competence protein ComEC